MKKFYRLFWFGTILLMLAAAACAPSETSTPTAFETLSAGSTSATDETPITIGTASTEETATGLDGTASISGTAVASPTSETLTPAIPVTGLDVNVVDCQFCVDDLAHALLIMPDTTSFKVTSPASTANASGLTCTTIEVSNGKQVVLCSGPQSQAITLNVCSSTGNCSDIPIKLIDCPLTSSSNGATPNRTQTAVTTSPTVEATSTFTPAGVSIATVTPTP